MFNENDYLCTTTPLSSVSSSWDVIEGELLVNVLVIVEYGHAE